MICFANPGLIDIRAVTTLGVNAKEGASPIGYFGTGLKYAIAVLLREGQQIEVWSGLEHFQFCSERTSIRGKSFEIVTMNGQALGWTTELGKNWDLRGAYRELWSNCKDEQGEVVAGAGFAQCEPDPSATRIVVRGKKFEQVHATRYGEVLLPPSLVKIGETTKVEVYAGESEFVYYHGIRAHKLAKPGVFTYNLLYGGLTEDRTLSGGTYCLDEALRAWLTTGASEELCASALCAGEAKHEGGMYFGYGSSASPEFLGAVRRGLVRDPKGMNASAVELFNRLTPTELEEQFVEIELTEEQEAERERAVADLDAWGYDLTGYLIRFADLGSQCLGRASGKTLLIHPRNLDDADMLRATLIEELVHLKFKVRDESRAMQEVLLKELVRLGYALNEARVAAAALKEETVF